MAGNSAVDSAAALSNPTASGPLSGVNKDALSKAVNDSAKAITASPGVGASTCMVGFQTLGANSKTTSENFKEVEEMVKSRWTTSSAKVLDPFYEEGDGSLAPRPNQKAFIYAPIDTKDSWNETLKVDDTPFAKFILESVAYSRSEKYHITETFTTSFVSFYGSRPVIYEISGQAFDTKSHNWMNEFEENFESVYRGTMALYNGAKVYLYFDGCILEGYPISFSRQKQSSNQMSGRFSMGIIRTGFKRMDTPVVDMQARAQQVKSVSDQKKAIKVIQDAKDTVDKAYTALNQVKSLAGNLTNTLSDTANMVANALGQNNYGLDKNTFVPTITVTAGEPSGDSFSRNVADDLKGYAIGTV